MADQEWREAVAEVWELFKESRIEFNESLKASRIEFNKNLEADRAEFRERQAETDRLFKETDQKLRRLEGLFTSQWGRLMERLVEPGVLNLFQERGMVVHQIAPRVKSQMNGRTMELDLVLENSTEVVIVEVKTTLKVQHVQDFLADMDELFYFFPRFRTYKVYAGVVGMDIVEEADRYAYRQGLFVLSVGGEGTVYVKNDRNFTPRNFAPTA
jgi:hypothetical protein